MDKRYRWLEPFGFPLYVPNQFVRLSYGRRIPKNPNWGTDAFPVYVEESHVEPDLDAERIMRYIGGPMLDRFRSPEALRVPRPLPVTEAELVLLSR